MTNEEQAKSTSAAWCASIADPDVELWQFVKDALDAKGAEHADQLEAVATQQLVAAKTCHIKERELHIFAAGKLIRIADEIRQELSK